MDLVEAMRTTGSVRDFRAHAVPLAIIHGVLDNARFAPSGGNRQGWRVIVISDSGIRRALGDLFREGWYTSHAPMFARAGRIERWDYADHIEDVPVHLVVLMSDASIRTTIGPLDTSRVIGGASVYPFVQNVLLGLREQGLGTTLTTVIATVADQVNQLLGIPPGYHIAAHLTVGWPARPFPQNLRRRPVEEFATVDKFDGSALSADA
jgi:nitroreductase